MTLLRLYTGDLRGDLLTELLSCWKGFSSSGWANCEPLEFAPKKRFSPRENSEFDPSEPPKYLWTYKIRRRHGGQSSVDSSSTWVCNHPAISKNTSHRCPSVWEEHAGVALCVTWPTSRDSVLWRSIWRKTGFPSRISFETSINLYDYTIRQIWNQQQVVPEYVRFPPRKLESILANWVYPSGPRVFHARSQWTSNYWGHAYIRSKTSGIRVGLFCLQCWANGISTTLPWILRWIEKKQWWQLYIVRSGRCIEPFASS